MYHGRATEGLSHLMNVYNEYTKHLCLVRFCMVCSCVWACVWKSIVGGNDSHPMELNWMLRKPDALEALGCHPAAW